MQEQANVSLSAVELQLVNNRDWILTKNGILQKAVYRFARLGETFMAEAMVQRLPSDVKAIACKVSRGEQYKGLPYVMLDYPRVFGKEDVLAVRTFFWWGNYFSCTLQLKGTYREMYGRKIMQALQQKIIQPGWLNTSGEEWEHDITSAHYKPAAETDYEEWLTLPALKIVYTFPLDAWNHADALLQQCFREIMTVLADND